MPFNFNFSLCLKSKFTAMTQSILMGYNKNEFFDLLDEYFRNRKTPPNENSTTEDDFISQVETARLTGVTVQTIIRWRKEGLLNPYTIKRKIFFRKSEVINAMRNNERLIK